MEKEKEKKKPSYSVLSNVLYILKLQKAHRSTSVFWLLLTIPLGLIISAIDIYLPKLVIHEATNETDILKIAIHILSFFALIIIFRAIAVWLDNKNKTNSLLFTDSVQELKMQKCLNTDYENVESQDFRTLMDRADRVLWGSGGISAIERVSYSFVDLITIILKYILFTAVLSFADIRLVILLTIMPLVNFFMAKWIQKFEFKNKEEMSLLEQRLWYVANTCGAFDAAKDIRIYGLTDWLVNKFKAITKERVEWDKKIAWKNSVANVVDVLLILIRDGAAYFILISMVLSGEISVDEFALYFAAVGSYATWIGGIIGKFSELNGISLLMCDFRDFHSYPDKSNRESSSVPVPADKGCKIEIKDLCYKYETAEKDTLSNISFTINPGENIAIVGINGAGKTTLIKNLCGLYAPTGGEILIDGEARDKYNIYDYYSIFSAVFQDYKFLPVTIAENISCTDITQCDVEKVKKCLRLVGMDEKINSLEKGIYSKLDRQLNEDGVDFSGGEKQKLLIARAIYKDAPVLILDEPTAALDAIAERDLYLKYAELSKDKTTIYISHRLASTQFCDRTIVMENGKIAEVGTHEELLKMGGIYSEMYEKQSSYYRDEVAS